MTTSNVNECIDGLHALFGLTSKKNIYCRYERAVLSQCDKYAGIYEDVCSVFDPSAIHMDFRKKTVHRGEHFNSTGNAPVIPLTCSAVHCTGK